MSERTMAIQSVKAKLAGSGSDPDRLGPTPAPLWVRGGSRVPRGCSLGGGRSAHDGWARWIHINGGRGAGWDTWPEYRCRGEVHMVGPRSLRRSFRGRCEAAVRRYARSRLGVVVRRHRCACRCCRANIGNVACWACGCSCSCPLCLAFAAPASVGSDVPFAPPLCAAPRSRRVEWCRGLSFCCLATCRECVYCQHGIAVAFRYRASGLAGLRSVLACWSCTGASRWCTAVVASASVLVAELPCCAEFTTAGGQADV